MNAVSTILNQKFNLGRDDIHGDIVITLANTGHAQKQYVHNPGYGKQNGDYLGKNSKLSIWKITYENSTYRFWLKKYKNDSNVKQYVTASSVADIVNFVANNPADGFKTLIVKEKENIARSEARIKEAEAKIEFMKANNSTKFNEAQFKTYQVLKLIKENPEMDLFEQSKLIAAIVEQK
jgi:hypothetical protein